MIRQDNVECPICENLRLCDRLLRQTTDGMTAPVTVTFAPLYMADTLPDYQGVWNAVTPVGD